MTGIFREDSALDDLRCRLRRLKKDERAREICGSLCIAFTIVLLIAICITATAIIVKFILKQRDEYDDFMIDDEDDYEEEESDEDEENE